MDENTQQPVVDDTAQDQNTSQPVTDEVVTEQGLVMEDGVEAEEVSLEASVGKDIKTDAGSEEGESFESPAEEIDQTAL